MGRSTNTLSAKSFRSFSGRYLQSLTICTEGMDEWVGGGGEAEGGGHSVPSHEHTIIIVRKEIRFRVCGPYCTFSEDSAEGWRLQ